MKLVSPPPPTFFFLPCSLHCVPFWQSNTNMFNELISEKWRQTVAWSRDGGGIKGRERERGGKIDQHEWGERGRERGRASPPHSTISCIIDVVSCVTRQRTPRLVKKWDVRWISQGSLWALSLLLDWSASSKTTEPEMDRCCVIILTPLIKISPRTAVPIDFHQMATHESKQIVFRWLRLFYDV